MAGIPPGKLFKGRSRRHPVVHTIVYKEQQKVVEGDGDGGEKANFRIANFMSMLSSEQMCKWC